MYFCARVSPMRPAPVELPQGRKAARVDGGAVRHSKLTLLGNASLAQLARARDL